MPFGHNPAQLRDALIALIAAAADTPAAGRMYRRMLAAALTADETAQPANENWQFAARAMTGLARICRNTADQLRVRADVTLIAEAMEEAGDHFEGLADAVTRPPLRLVWPDQ